MAATAVKPEIKLDPATQSTDISQLEEFEDDTDLHVPDPNGQQAWLVKVPSHLWAAWNEIYRTAADETPIEIGKMRVYNPKPGETPLQQKIQIRLAPGVPQHSDIPKNYNIDLKTEGYNNVVVFSEKDLPGHKLRNDVVGRSRAHLKPAGIPAKSERYGTSSGSTKPGSYRSAIPKQTALAPVIQHMADATPVQDASYDDWIEKTYKAAMKPKRTTNIYHGVDRGMHPGNRSANFTLTSRVGAGRKPPPKEKAVRMSQEDLLDRIYQCFREYKYWSLKALKFKLKQPETFIKQTLDSIAVLVRSGDFAMNYKLKDEYESVANIKLDEVKNEIPDIKSEDDGSMAEDAEMEDGDDDDDGEDFEDVKMEGAASKRAVLTDRLATPTKPSKAQISVNPADLLLPNSALKAIISITDSDQLHEAFLAEQMSHREKYSVEMATRPSRSDLKQLRLAKRLFSMEEREELASRM